MPDNTFNIFQQQLVCSICLDRYKQPKLLPCQHTFCLSPCLTNLADRVTNRIKCPECRTVHTLPFQGVDALPNNLTLLRFLELDSDYVPSNCFQCERRGQNTKCPDCGKYFCQNCKRIHLAHLQNEIKIKINNLRKSLTKSAPMQVENPIYNELKQEISNAFGTLIAELKKRENDLINEIELFKQSGDKKEITSSMSISEVNSVEINYFCDLTESIINTSQAVNENQLAKMKQQCQHYMDDLNKPKIPNGLTPSQNRLTFSANNLNELKNLIQKLGSLSRGPVQDTISQQNTTNVNTNELQSNRQRATWNKAPASFTIDFSSTNQNNQTSQSSRDIHSDKTPKPITRSKTFVISTDPVENLNEPAKSIDVNALYNVKPQTRAKTPLSFNVMLNEPSNFDDIEQSSHQQDFLTSSLSNVSNKPKIEYGSRKKAVKIIGKQGKENGEFNWPLDLAINSFNNNILVTDSRNHRIQIFDQEGKFSRCFGGMGTKDAEFNSPTGIFIDTMSNVYVVDRLNHRIQIFDRYCRYLRSVSSGQGNQPGQLNNPWGIAVNKISEIFVCDKENDRICVFNPSGKFLRSFGRYGSENGCLDKPCYIHVTKDNKVFVSDCMNHRIQVFDTNGVFLFKFGREGTKSGEFKFPRGITSDQEGCILVADSGNSRIQVFRNDGRYMAEFGTKGIDSGMFQGIEGLCLNKNSNVLICDKDNNRIQIL